MLRIAQIIATAYLGLAIILAGVTVLVGPVGSAPLPLSNFVPAGEPIVITLTYSTEKRAWLEAARDRYLQTNPRVRGRPVQIMLQGAGSRTMVLDVVQNRSQPTVISPASSIQIELLRNEWQQRRGSTILHSDADAPRPLVLSPLVLVGWEERARALWPNGSRNFWADLHSALTNRQGWSGLGGDPRWGPVKFGHTSPETSNSGMQTLVLLAYGYHNKSRDLTVQDVQAPAFVQWMKEIEQATPGLGTSTGTFMDDVVRRGPSGYDFVVTYENLALQNLDAASRVWQQAYRIYYPPATIMSDHPYAILDAPWVTPEQREAAANFRDFLLARPTQELALQLGFRPVLPDLSAVNNVPNNPFSRYANYGSTPDIPQQAAIPSADVLSALLAQWQTNIQR